MEVREDILMRGTASHVTSSALLGGDVVSFSYSVLGLIEISASKS